MLKINETFVNPVKSLLKEKKKVCGGWLQLASTLSSEIMGKAEFDVLMVDMEHGPSDFSLLLAQFQALKGYGVSPFVRAPWNDFVAIKRILDAGAYGVLVPYVNTKEEAELAVSATIYPPHGIRGVAPSPRAPGYGMNSRNYLDHADEQIVVMTAVETPEAIANLDEILTVEGLDGIFIGPMDLATSMGHRFNPGHEEVKAAVAKVEEKVFASNKYLASVAPNLEAAKAMYDRGYSLVLVMSDAGTVAKAAMETTAKFKEMYPNR